MRGRTQELEESKETCSENTITILVLSVHLSKKKSLLLANDSHYAIPWPLVVVVAIVVAVDGNGRQWEVFQDLPQIPRMR